MSSKKVCRYCEGTDFYFTDVGARGGMGPDLLPIGGLIGPRLTMRVCGKCGIIDWFVGPQDLPAVRKQFVRNPE